MSIFIIYYTSVNNYYLVELTKDYLQYNSANNNNVIIITENLLYTSC